MSTVLFTHLCVHICVIIHHLHGSCNDFWQFKSLLILESDSRLREVDNLNYFLSQDSKWNQTCHTVILLWFEIFDSLDLNMYLRWRQKHKGCDGQDATSMVFEVLTGWIWHTAASLKEKYFFFFFLFFCILSLIIRVFTIIYYVLQHYYDKPCSPESWSSLLTSLMNSRAEEAFKVLWQSGKRVVLKDESIAKCLVVSSHVTTPKHKVKQQQISRKHLFVCLFPKAAETLVSRLKAIVQCSVLVSEHETTPLNIQRLSRLVFD